MKLLDFDEGLDTTVTITRAKSKKPRQTKIKNAALTSSDDPNWVTPDEGVLDVERAMWADLGLVIDLDPYSSNIANKIVRATRYLTEADDGFAQPHVCEAQHNNHPGGTTKQAWKKLIDEVRLGNTKRACWIGFSVAQLCILADGGDYPHPMDYSAVLLRKRVDFLKEATLLPGGRPAHGNYVCLINVPCEIVEKHWGPRGHVTHGKFAI